MPGEYFELKTDMYTLRLSRDQPLHACDPWQGKPGERIWHTECGLRFPRTSWVLRKAGQVVHPGELCQRCTGAFIRNHKRWGP